MIYLLRHGETLWNTMGRFQGQQDSPLTETGVRQAEDVGLLLRQHIADAGAFEMQLSPLGRARETARGVLNILPMDSREDSRLMEVTAGCWDGLTRLEIDSEYPGMLDGADPFDWYFRSPDGESFDDACSRARRWIAEVRKPTIAVSHGLFGRLIRGAYAGLSRQEMLQLPVPQDGFYVLGDGVISFVAGPEDAIPA